MLLATVLLSPRIVHLDLDRNVVRVVSETHHTIFKPVLLSLLLWPLCAVLASCGLWVKTQAWVGKEIALTVQVDETANENAPIAVDVLFVSDKKTLAELSRLPASEWFRQKSQIQKDSLHNPGFTLWEWEWVPGQNVPVQYLPLQPRARAGLIFASYRTSGEHRAFLPPHDDIFLRLGRTGFVVGEDQLPSIQSVR
ncbi:MAG: hypothetical protein KC563_01850 [Nitrospira sp.]|nr:hypothetical protein [Nitrospira sp.]MCA9474545.1 hypothetical protein [Nitrospira sp.]MCA9479907.1 hypothetical protein [Nitrospira sp.]MCB9711008.1 hypothetical protein [Nitrospiraceae bacterium]